MKRRDFLKAAPLIAAPAALIPEVADAEPINVGLINTFKSNQEAEAHRLKIKDPELYGILSMYGKNNGSLYAVVEKRILRMFV